MTPTPIYALSIRQPWAWLIVNGYKDIENRNWKTYFRGSIYIHAGKGMTANEYEICRLTVKDINPEIILPPPKDLPRGGIVGIAEITNCVSGSQSPWFFGEYGFVLRNARPLPFRECRGELGLFRPANAKSAPRSPATCTESNSAKPRDASRKPSKSATP